MWHMLCSSVLARKEVWIQLPVLHLGACLQITNLHICLSIQFKIFLKNISYHFLWCNHLLSNSARHEKISCILLGICVQRASRFFEKTQEYFFCYFSFFVSAEKTKWWARSNNPKLTKPLFILEHLKLFGWSCSQRLVPFLKSELIHPFQWS